MSEEHEMYLIRNIKNLKDDKIETVTTEYEIIADAHIVGSIAFGPYYFTIWEFLKGEKEGEPRKLCLRIKEKAEITFIPGISEPPKSPYYHGGGIADEFVALASLFLRRRLILGAQVRRDDKPEIIPRKIGPRWIDKQLITGRSNLKDLGPCFKQLENFNPKFHQRFILAVKFYHQAIEIIEERPVMAYLNLVSAIESLCQDFDIGEVKLKEIDGKLADLIDKIENNNIKTELEEHILKKNRFIKRRFVSFILEYLGDSFWKEPRPERGFIKPNDLPELLKKIYDQRSRTLHMGEPFPPIEVLLDEEEICNALGFSHMEKEWTPDEFIPNINFFERLVNHVLKNFILKNQIV